jgi:uncharacterized protein
VPSPLRLNAVELLRRPGSERVVETSLTIGELGIDDSRFRSDEPVDVSLRLEALTDGIVVTGNLRSTWHGTCRRCAAPAVGQLDSEVHELYQRIVTDPDAFELGDLLDLEPMVRELLLLDAPLVPLCRPDCLGLCPICGVDRNAEPCSCTSDTPDPRWAALDELKGRFDS